jgi:hypothetical protein
MKIDNYFGIFAHFEYHKGVQMCLCMILMFASCRENDGRVKFN